MIIKRVEIQNFLNLSNNNIYSMPKIKWWLLKNRYAYRISKQVEKQKNTFIDADEETTYSPSFSKPTEEYKLIELYEALNELLEVYIKENFYKTKFEEYESIKNNKEEFNIWLNAINEEEATEYLVFLIDYLDYDKSYNVYHLLVPLIINKEIKLFINRLDFKYTIKYFEVVNNNYWQD